MRFLEFLTELQTELFGIGITLNFDQGDFMNLIFFVGKFTS